MTSQGWTFVLVEWMNSKKLFFGSGLKGNFLHTVTASYNHFFGGICNGWLHEKANLKYVCKAMFTNNLCWLNKTFVTILGNFFVAFYMLLKLKTDPLDLYKTNEIIKTIHATKCFHHRLFSRDQSWKKKVYRLTSLFSAFKIGIYD